MNKAEYFAIVKAWTEKYGTAKTIAVYNPAKVKTTCAHCHKMRPHMARHHKANDFFFALHFPDIYAERYIQFLDEDCDKLCSACHRQCHEYFKALTRHLYDEFAILSHPEVSTSRGEWILWCEKWKEAFRSAYINWNARNKRHRKNLVPKPEV